MLGELEIFVEKRNRRILMSSRTNNISMVWGRNIVRWKYMKSEDFATLDVQRSEELSEDWSRVF